MAAVMAVLLLVGTVLAVVRALADPVVDAGPAPAPTTPASTPSSAPLDAGEAEPGWRTETWRGMSVDVPATWAVGGSPLADGGSAGWVDCGSGVAPGEAYVGRPVRLGETCTPYDASAPPEPTAAYVWFGAPGKPGERSWPSGFVAETVEVAGERVTVAVDDRELRARIVGSVREAGPTDDHGCPAVQPDEVAAAGEPEGGVERVSICVYERTASTWELLWSGSTGPDEARALVTAVGDRTPDRFDCAAGEGTVRIQLHVWASDGTAGYVVRRPCRTLLVPDGSLPLDDALTAPWLVPGVQVYSPLGE